MTDTARRRVQRNPNPRSIDESMVWFESILLDGIRKLESDMLSDGIDVDQVDVVLEHARREMPEHLEAYRRRWVEVQNQMRAGSVTVPRCSKSQAVNYVSSQGVRCNE
jgi:hypothetical protein